MSENNINKNPEENNLDEKETSASEVPENDVGESNAAKRLRMLGISVEEEPPADPIKKAGFFENFWYHYKFLSLAVLFGVIVIGIGIFQLVSKTSPDIYIMYAGEKYYDNTAGITGAFIGAMPKDYNGDGEKTVNILQIRSLTDAQKNEIKAQDDAMANEYKEGAVADANIDESFLSSEASRFREEIIYGESVICIISPELYNEIKGNNVLLTLEEALGYKPKNAVDDYALKFKELSIIEYYSVFDSLPDDTLIVIRRVTAMTSIKGKKAEERHKNHVDYFKALVEFKEPYLD